MTFLRVLRRSIVLPALLSALALVSSASLVSAHSCIKCIKMERAADGTYTKCWPGSLKTVNFYMPHATSASYSGKLTHNEGAPPQLAQIAQGETFTYVWPANNHGDYTSTQNELYRQPNAATSNSGPIQPQA